MRVAGVVRWLGGLLAVLAVILLPAGPAAAHSDLKSSDPADGATLVEAPAAVSFTFNEQLLAQGNAVVLTELMTGTRLEVGPVEVDGETVSVDWPERSGAGQYRAAYRVVSADGHPIDGSITFTVESSGESPWPTAQSSPSEATPSAEQSPTTGATPTDGTPSPVAVATPTSPAPDDTDPGVLAWVLGLGVVVLVGAGAGTWFMRRSR
jgi:methionine-rich copper-binding protein CopC